MAASSTALPTSSIAVTSAPCTNWQLQRFELHHPLINGSTRGVAWRNIVGPSVIKSPAWLPTGNLPGRYLMYFASHAGEHMRVAYADAPAGPWTIHPAHILPVRSVPHCRGHIASPDVHIEAAKRTIGMYFHCHPAGQGGKQWTYLAHSSDGIDFRPEQPATAVKDFYFRRFRLNGSIYAIAKQNNDGGVLYRSPDGGATFRKQPGVLPNMRHAAVLGVFRLDQRTSTHALCCTVHHSTSLCKRSLLVPEWVRVRVRVRVRAWVRVLVRLRLRLRESVNACQIS